VWISVGVGVSGGSSAGWVWSRFRWISVDGPSVDFLEEWVSVGVGGVDSEEVGLKSRVSGAISKVE
jgi:hypothetical protein